MSQAPDSIQKALRTNSSSFLYSGAQSIIDVAMAAADVISDQLLRLKEFVVAGREASDSDRVAYQTETDQILRFIDNIVENAEFDGQNLLKNEVQLELVNIFNVPNPIGGVEPYSISGVQVVDFSENQDSPELIVNTSSETGSPSPTSRFHQTAYQLDDEFQSTQIDQTDISVGNTGANFVGNFGPVTLVDGRQGLLYHVEDFLISSPQKRVEFQLLEKNVSTGTYSLSTLDSRLIADSVNVRPFVADLNGDGFSDFGSFDESDPNLLDNRIDPANIEIRAFISDTLTGGNEAVTDTMDSVYSTTANFNDVSNPFAIDDDRDQSDELLFTSNEIFSEVDQFGSAQERIVDRLHSLGFEGQPSLGGRFALEQSVAVSESVIGGSGASSNALSLAGFFKDLNADGARDIGFTPFSSFSAGTDQRRSYDFFQQLSQDIINAPDSNSIIRNNNINNDLIGDVFALRPQGNDVYLTYYENDGDTITERQNIFAYTHDPADPILGSISPSFLGAGAGDIDNDGIEEVIFADTQANLHIYKKVDNDFSFLSSSTTLESTRIARTNLNSAGLGISNLTIGNIDSVEAVDSASQRVIEVLSRLGAQASALEISINALNVSQDVVEVGIGNLVDANLAEESAALQALQVKEQLGLQALQIANRSSQLISSLFQ